MADKVWRWNSDIEWHYFSSLQFEAFNAQVAKNDFARYHHLRSCLYFAVGTLEVFLNRRITKFLREEGYSERSIKQKINAPLNKKWGDWVERIYGARVIENSGLDLVFNEFKKIRNEITHPKRIDHSIYKELDSVEATSLIEAVSEGLVLLFEAEQRAFPYWLLSWNFVGANGDPCHPCLLNNQNGFMYSLRAMNFQVPVGDASEMEKWERLHMTSLEGFKKLRLSLDLYPEDIEPFQEMLPTKPRLCRRWWDRTLILGL